eukprot:snap_masked-scaffold_38-processed-gene-1.29-mRNA-1 protein AED:1.00 eAED:1.00 QI:0/0/0/0/1/1/2/0/347
MKNLFRTILTTSAYISLSLAQDFEAFQRCKGFLSHGDGSKGRTPWVTNFDTMLNPNVENISEFQKAMQVLLDVCNVTDNRDEATAVIKDFEFINGLRPEVGVNGVAYKYVGTEADDRFTYLMFAFRGSVSASDNCATEVYFIGQRSQPCIDAFSLEDLDYVSQANEFILSTVNSLGFNSIDRVKVLLTGHSLGSAMSTYMNTFYQDEANLVAFTPKIRFASFTMAGVGIRSIIASEQSGYTDEGCSVMLYNQHDPVPKLFLQNQVGYICKYPDEQVVEPQSCVECYAADPVTYDGCNICFDDTHYIWFYEDLINGPESTLPTCELVALQFLAMRLSLVLASLTKFNV